MRRGGGQPQVGNYVNQKGTAAGSNSGGGTPDNIQCQVCKKMKPKGQYANRQLQKYSAFNKSSARNPNSARATCKTCTPGQTTELTCYICENTKGLTEFAKNQRKDPDKARCTKCVNKVLETEPDMTPPSSDVEEEDEDTDNDDWTSGTKNPVGKTSYKAPALTSQGSKNRGSQYTASSADAGQYASSSSSHGTVAPNRSGNVGGVAEPRSHSYAGSVASSVATTKSHATPHSRTPTPAASTASSAVGGEGIWETVGAAGPPVATYGTPWGNRAEGSSSTATPSYRSASTARVAPIDMKSNGWAKVAKIPKGKEQKWGEGNATEHDKAEEGGEDIWAKYGRDLRDAKAGKAGKAGKVTKKKMADRFED